MARPTIHQVHIADGFTDDCEELIHQCLKTDILTYESFCEIWKNMQFGFLYHGRPSGTEMAELSEELLHIAKHYMVINTSNFEESVAGLFIVYGILNLQPFSGFAALRIVPEDVPAINRIEMVARRQKRYDVLYILGSLLIEGPVQYHAAARERGMESGIKKYLEGQTSIDRLGVRPKGVFYRQNEELDIIRELNCITRRYSDAKKAIAGENSRNLNFINNNFPSELDSSLKKILNGIVEKNEEAEEKILDHYERVQALKDKAMKLRVDSVKYLQSSDTKDKSSANTTLQTNSETNLKQNSHKKNIKKQKNIFRADKKRLLGAGSSDSSSEDNIPDDDKTSEHSENDFSDVDLDNFDKDNNLNEEKEVDIKVDSLPVFVRTEYGGKEFEIEFIDKCENDAKNKLGNDKTAKDTLEDAGEGTSSGSTRAETAKTKVTNLKFSKNSVLLKKPEKRDLKKTLLKSKFKRMGMLKVANFDEKQISDKCIKKYD